MILQENTHTHTLSIFAYCISLSASFPSQVDFNFLIKEFYFSEQKLSFHCFVWCLFSSLQPLLLMFPLVLFWCTHVVVMSRRSTPQHPSHFFFTAQIFLPLPNVSARTEQPIWPLPPAALSEILADIEWRMRRATAGGVVLGSSGAVERSSGVPTGSGDWLQEKKIVEMNTQTSFARLYMQKVKISHDHAGICLSRLI